MSDEKITAHVHTASDTGSTAGSPGVISTQPGLKKGLFGRAVDSFKPPVGQKGWVPEGSHAAVTVRHVDDHEKNMGIAEIVDETYDDNGGLKRALHGRHLQVRSFYSNTFS